MKRLLMSKIKGMLIFLKTYAISICIILGAIVLGCFALKLLFPVEKYFYITNALEKATTVLISMIGFSVSAYVFLNNTLQRKSIDNPIEIETIGAFLKKKRISLCSLMIWSISLVVVTIFIMAIISKDGQISAVDSTQNSLIYIIYICLVLSVFSIIRLCYFDFSIINYEKGLVDTARLKLYIFDKEITNTKPMKKNEFLILVNNMETVIERISANHQDAPVHFVDDSLVRLALFSKIDFSSNTGIQQQATRRRIADQYRETIKYRNYVLHLDDLKDDDEIDVGDFILSTVNLVFQNVLAGEVLSDISLSNLTLSSVNFEKTAFRNSVLKSINIKENSSLRSADLRDSVLQNISFDDADCRNINLSNAKLVNVIFSDDTKLSGSVFSNADMTGLEWFGTKDCTGKCVDVQNSNFIKANLIHLDIQNVCFDNCDMQKVQLFDSKIGYSSNRECNTTFKFANLKEAILSNCKINKCDFTNSNLTDATLSYSHISKTIWSESRLHNATFIESKINECDFKKSYCSNVSFKGAVIKRSSFNYATINLSDFSATELLETTFDDAVCSDALFVGTTVKNTSFVRCILSNSRIVSDQGQTIDDCNFNLSNLSNSSISNVQFTNCSFYGCDFSNSRLINVSFVDCTGLETVRFKNAWLDSVTLNSNIDEEALRETLRYAREVDKIVENKILD